MILAIVGVMKIEVIAKKLAADRVMTERAMHHRLCKGHEVVRGARGTDKQQKLRNGQQYRLKHRCLPLRERKLARQTSPCQASPPVPGACWPTLSFSSGSRAADRPNRGEMPVGVASSLAIAGFGSPSASPMPPASLA